MENKINRITDILRRDDGISGAMMCTEQISWILFLKYLNDYEEAKHDEALLDGKEYSYILDEKYRWNNWAYPRKDGKLDKINAKAVMIYCSLSMVAVILMKLGYLIIYADN